MTYELNMEKTIQKLAERGVELDHLAELTYFLQQDYFPDLTKEECLESVKKVLSKREVQNAVMTGIQLDVLAERGQLEPPLADIIRRDDGLYGCDEILAMSIINVYGSIGFTNFGYIDKMKPGILKKLNDKNGPHCHTFLDDLVGAIAAASSGRIAHDRSDGATPVPVASIGW